MKQSVLKQGDVLYTYKDISSIVKLSVGTLRNAMSNGLFVREIHYFKGPSKNGIVRFTQSGLDRLLRQKFML